MPFDAVMLRSEERMARGKGRNISNRNLFAICRYLDKWTPQNETEKRDKEIKRY